MVVMKILRKPKKKTIDSISNNNSELHIKVRNIIPKKLNLDKFSTEKIKFN